MRQIIGVCHGECSEPISTVGTPLSKYLQDALGLQLVVDRVTLDLLLNCGHQFNVPTRRVHLDKFRPIMRLLDPYHDVPIGEETSEKLR